MSAPRSHRRSPLGLPARRLWVPALAVLAVLVVLGGVLWALPGSSDPVPAAATSSSAAPTTSRTVVTTTAAPATTTEAPPTTTEAVTTEPLTTAAPSPEPAPAPAPQPAPAPAAAADPGDPGAEAAVVDLVNAERAQVGCAPVVADAGLAAVARAHSADMRDRDYFSHTTPEGLSPWDRAAAAGVTGASAENIAQGYGDAASVMAGWMDSPGHRDNILDCSNTRLGVGMVQGGSGPTWTQLFGR